MWFEEMMKCFCPLFVLCVQIVLPRVLHAPIAVVGDYFVMKLTTRVFGPSPAKWAVSKSIMSGKVVRPLYGKQAYSMYSIASLMMSSPTACIHHHHSFVRQ